MGVSNSQGPNSEGVLGAFNSNATEMNNNHTDKIINDSKKTLHLLEYEK